MSSVDRFAAEINSCGSVGFTWTGEVGGDELHIDVIEHRGCWFIILVDAAGVFDIERDAQDNDAIRGFTSCREAVLYIAEALRVELTCDDED